MKIVAPWTNEQVETLFKWQTSGRMHPYTCANRNDGNHTTIRFGDHGVLYPTNAGWRCFDCDYTQDWAHG